MNKKEMEKILKLLNKYAAMLEHSLQLDKLILDPDEWQINKINKKIADLQEVEKVIEQIEEEYKERQQY